MESKKGVMPVGEKTICLNMIVKNESHIIRETLTHLLGFIRFDYWVISDTGSTDGTQTIIRDFFAEAGIPGELTEDAWRDFGHNRSVALLHARDKADYVFVWDADDTIAGEFRLPPVLDADCYSFTFGGDNGFRYNRSQLFNNRKRWRYVGVLHEYAECEEPTPPVTVRVTGNYHFVSGRKGARNADPRKYERDAEILENALVADPKNTRNVFYCANSHMDAGNREAAVTWYKRRIEMEGGWDEEKYVSCIQLADALSALGRATEAIPFLIDGFRYSPTRIECTFRLVRHYCVRQMNDVAWAFYTLVQKSFEANKASDRENKLFLRGSEYDFYFPYYVCLVALHLQKFDTVVRMYDRIFQSKTIPLEMWMVQALFSNLQFLPAANKSFDLLQRALAYRSIVFLRHPEVFGPDQNRAIERLILDVSGAVAATPKRLPTRGNSKANPRILLSITTCKRLDLFERTMNSVLNTWSDIDKVEYFLCVDDNSSESDRARMKELYPFFDFVWKGPADRGHRQSMNIIWQRLHDLRPTYWIHLEDDWLFFRRVPYIMLGTMFLDKYAAQGIHQLLFNRNYTETYADGWQINGGEPLEAGFLVHVKSDTIPGRSSGYWPHYSFRPSIVRTDIVLGLGNFDSPNTFFERDYADRWFAAGHRSGFANDIVSLHIGKLTSERNGTNAYALNDVTQFGGAATTDANATATAIQFSVLNLKRRPDRLTSFQNETSKIADFPAVSVVEAVDGKTLERTDQITNLFWGNDFGSRRGVIGCALSHYMNFWKRLCDDSAHAAYTIFEDDVTFSDRFLEGYQVCTKHLSEYDVIFLGFSKFRNVEVAATAEFSVGPLDKTNYMGGLFGYIITKSGASKMCDFIQKNGIKHGIDYVMKIASELRCGTISPPIVLSEYVRSASDNVDSDIQKDYNSLNLLPDGWKFHPRLDSPDNDTRFIGRKPITELLAAVKDTDTAVNTLGFVKSRASFPLKPSRYFGPTDGLFVRDRIRVKPLCNWCDSAQLCREWEPMTRGNGTWNALQLTADDDNVDYYVIINKPPTNATFDPARTVVFQMEPWCGESWQTWGVKTWGEWAKPDPARFLHVHSPEQFSTPAFWQLSLTYSQLKTMEFPKTRGMLISSIVSPKYVDPGHRLRVDFLKFLEEKGDPLVRTEIYGKSNTHGFRNYVGPITPDNEKEKSIAPYEYYFMCENNAEHNYVTEKLWEPILTETLCFYWGAPNVGDIVDPRAYVALDMGDFEAAYATIRRAITEDWWSQRLPYIRAAKERILEQNAFMPTLERIIQKQPNTAAPPQ